MGERVVNPQAVEELNSKIATEKEALISGFANIYRTGNVRCLKIGGTNNSSVLLTISAKDRPQENMAFIGRYYDGTKYYPLMVVINIANGTVNGYYFNGSTNVEIDNNKSVQITCTYVV